MIKEIGSEFCENPIIDSKNRFDETNGCFTFLDSGRSAIRAIIRDIKADLSDFKVYMPDYYCETMIKPFVEQGVKLEFYKVDFSDDGITFDYDFKNDCQVVFLVGYFGFYNPQIESIIENEKSRGKIIIYDATQSVFNKYPKTDYVFASFRKWFFSFSAVILKNEKFKIKLPNDKNKEYISLKSKAALLKNDYLYERSAEKKEYLKLYGDSEKILDDQTKEYVADADELFKIDFGYIKKKRKENASFLIEEIKNLDLKEINLPFKQVSGYDVPLFVPISVNSERDELRKAFIKNDIFLPVHWPLSSFHCGIDNIAYKKELSLVCDQRYGYEDMKRISNILYDSVTDLRG